MTKLKARKYCYYKVALGIPRAAAAAAAAEYKDKPYQFSSVQSVASNHRPPGAAAAAAAEYNDKPYQFSQ